MKKILLVSVTSGLIFLAFWMIRLFDLIENSFLLTLVSSLLFLTASFTFKILTPKVRANRFFALKNMSLLDWKVTLSLSFLLICGSFIINYFSGVLWGLLGVDAPSAFSGNSYSSLLLAVICIAVFPALFEEIYFRGAMLSILHTAGLKNWAVIGFSALIFALLHGPTWYFLTDLYAGILLGCTVFLTGSLYASVVVHFVANTVSIFLALYGGKLAEAGIGDLTLHVFVVCFLGGICHFLHLLKKLVLQREAEDRSNVNENSRRWEAQKKKGGAANAKK